MKLFNYISKKILNQFFPFVVETGNPTIDLSILNLELIDFLKPKSLANIFRKHMKFLVLFGEMKIQLNSKRILRIML
jgi:hypothetical protein